MDFFSIGIDIGGTNINWGIVDMKGCVIQSYTWKTNEFIRADYLSKKIHSTLLRNNFIDKIQGIGIGAPASNGTEGIINNSSNLPWKGIVPIVEIFKRDFDTIVILENDARSAAWGEKIFGGARAMKNYAFVTLGTGVGCGIVLDNKLLIGDNQFAGEIGHIIIEKNGRQCGCGRKGCLETYVSASGIVKTYEEISGNKSSGLSSFDIYRSALNNDIAAIDTFNYTAENLSLGLAQLITITGINNIFLFGGPSESGELLFSPLNKYLKDNLLHLINADFIIQKSHIEKQYAAIIGAAALSYSSLIRS